MDTTLANAMISPPAPLSVLGGSDRQFSEALDGLRAELAPVGLVEELLVDRVVLAVSRLRAVVSADAEGDPEPIARAEQSLDRALVALTASRSSRAQGWGHAATTCTRVADIEPMTPAPARPEPIPAPRAAVEPPSVDGLWRDRLMFDENVSDESPVVRGTWVTAGQVVSLIVDGWNWDDILRHYPELSERDIRACLAYTIEQDGPISL